MLKVREILGVDKESEFLQSFVRVGLSANQDDAEHHKSIYAQSKQQVTIAKQISDNRSEISDGRSPRRSRSSPAAEMGIIMLKSRRRRREYFEEMYTDKDRAAAVSYGNFDIKQSLTIKRRQDRTEALQLPDETDPSTLLALGQREFKSGNVEIAIMFISKAK